MLANVHPVCLTIGTSDSCGATGVQADLKTFTAFGCYGASVITALTAQSFTGVKDVHVLPDNFVRSQLEATSEDLPIVAIKVGLCPSVGTIRVIGRWLRANPKVRVVVDPVAADSRGIPLLQPEEIDALRQQLLPLATLITPNRFQAALLTGVDECIGQEAMEIAATTLFKTYGCPTVITDGGLDRDCRDVLVGMDGMSHFDAVNYPRTKVHGRSSTFSAAITASLAKGDSLREAILNARSYVSAAIAAAPQLNSVRNPLWHGVTPTEPVTGVYRKLS